MIARHPLCSLMALLSLAVSGLALSQDTPQKSDSWIGRSAYATAPSVRVRVDGPGGTEPRLFLFTPDPARVDKVEGNKIWVRTLDQTGWVLASEVVREDQAVEYFTAQLERNPQDDFAYRQRASAWIRRNEPARAVADLDRAIALKPTAQLHNYRGIAYVTLNQPTRALADYDAAIKLAPNSAVMFHNRGHAYRALKQHDQALADFDQAIRIIPAYADAYYDRGKERRTLHKLDEARADLEEAIRLDPRHAPARQERGDLRREQGDLDGALADFDAALAIDPKLAVAYNNRGITYALKKDFVRAIDDFERAIRLNPNVIAYGNRARARQKLRDYAGALADFTEATRLDGKRASAWEGIAWIRASCPESTLRDAKSAIEAAQKACELTGWKNASSLDALAAAYAEAGEFDRAIRYEQRTLELLGLTAPWRRFAEARLSLYEQKRPYRLPL